MILQKGARYILRFEIKLFELVYETTIIDDDGTHITFLDKKGKRLSYHHSKLITAEEVLDK